MLSKLVFLSVLYYLREEILENSEKNVKVKPKLNFENQVNEQEASLTSVVSLTNEVQTTEIYCHTDQ